MPMGLFEHSCPYKWGTREAKEWYRIEALKGKEREKAKKLAMKEKLRKYREICQQWHDKLIDWNTYCKLSKRYYQSPFDLAVYGIK